MMNSIVYALKSALFVTTAYPYGVIWFLVWGGALVFYLIKKSTALEKRRRKLFWIFFACVPLFLALFNVPKFSPEYHFRKACAEDSGLFVYEKVSLGPEYWLNFDRDFAFELDIVRLESGIARHSRVLKDLKSGKVLSEIKDYSAQIVYFMSQKKRKCQTVLGKDTIHADVQFELIRNTFTNKE